MRQVNIYKGFERFWHWTQALLILLLALTGFEVHGSYRFLGYRQAVAYHNAAAIALLVLIAFAIFWHFTTGEWRQYTPTKKHLRAYVEYYLVGVFHNAPHPTRKTSLSKLNPLQKLAYLGLKVLVIPVMVLSGLLYMFGAMPVRAIAVAHTAGAFLLLAFVIGHVYLTTTGRTVFSNLQAMITGSEELEDYDEPAGKPAEEELCTPGI